MPDGKRLWRTECGDLVTDGHPDAVLLAYGIDDALVEKDADKVRDPEALAVEPDPGPEKVEAVATAKPVAQPSAKRAPTKK